MKKMFMAVTTAVLFTAASFAVDLTFSVSPLVMASPSAFNEKADLGLFSYGYGAALQSDVDLFGLLNAGFEGQALILNSTANTGIKPGKMVAGGINLGVYYYPISRLYLGAGGAGGLIYLTQDVLDKENSTSTKDVYKTVDTSSFYYRGYGEVGFRINPAVTIGLNGGYAFYGIPGKVDLMDGFFGGVDIRITKSLGSKGSNDIGINIEQYGPVLPSYMNVYKNYPFATISLRNNSGAEIHDVHVSIRAGKYTSSSFQCASIGRIRKYGTEEISLLADFSEEILKFSENGKIQAEIVVDYEFLGKRTYSIQEVTLSVNNRNAFVWNDSAALSTFVSPDTPEILELSKYIAGVARNNFISAMNRSLQTAAAMVEGLRLCGISYSGDTETPYVQYHLSGETDSIQYPLQTLNYSSGDYDDIGILLMSCLESVGIGCAYMTVDDDFVVLVDTGLKPGQELNHFASSDGLLIDEQKVYFGLSMSALNKGFAACRKEGSKKIKKAIAGDYNSAEFVDVSESWAVYAPCVYSGSGSGVSNPNQAELTAKLNAAIKEYIDTDLAEVVNRARKSGDSNKLGVALFRAGRYVEAKKEFSKLNSLAAKNNLANVYMIEKNYAEAARIYASVLAQDPNNRIAKKGLDNANSKLGK